LNGNIVVGSIRLGDHLVLSRESIEHAVQVTAGEPEGVHWEGPSVVHVSTNAVQIPSAALVDPARDYLLRTIQPTHPTVVVSPLNADVSAFVRRGAAVRIQTRGTASNELASRMSVLVDLYQGHALVGTVTVPFAVQAFESVWVAAHPLQKNSPLKPDDLVAKQVDIAKRPALGIKADQVINKMIARRDIDAGEVLRASDVHALLAVNQGDHIDLTVQQGVVSVTTKAVALTDGAIGSMVRVQPVKGHVVVAALVMGPYRAQWSSQ
jgi:flagella basal body P-ring formation protein FlgA